MDIQIDQKINQKAVRRTLPSDDFHCSLPPLLALPLTFPLGSLVEPGPDSVPAGPGYAFMMLAKVAGTGGGDG